MSGRYILKGHEPVAEPDLRAWATWLEKADRVVAKTEIGEANVSTVFLGVDHLFGWDGPPVLFETMVFGGPLEGEQDRYCTWDEAAAGHEKMVARVKRAEAGGQAA